MGGYGGTVGIPLGFDTRPEEIRSSRLGQHDLRLGTMLLDVLTRSVEGASGPCLLLFIYRNNENEINANENEYDVRTQCIFDQSWRISTRTNERTDLFSLTVPRDPIIELDPDGVQVVDDLGPLSVVFRVGRSDTAQRSQGVCVCACAGIVSFRAIHNIP
jgi:hypothetical protein